MAINLPGKSSAPKFIGTRGVERHHHASGRARFGPQNKHAGRALLNLPLGFADQFGTALQQNHLAVDAKRVGGCMQVVIPGNDESMADSSVQSMNAPFGSSSL